jgi:hypothetical protein
MAPTGRLEPCARGACTHALGGGSGAVNENPVRALEATWQEAVHEERRLVLLSRLRGDAAAALGKGDIPTCQAVATLMAGFGGPLYAFHVPSDAAAWGHLLERLRRTLEDQGAHNRLMQTRLARHLRDPRPWQQSWRTAVRQTAVLQHEYAKKWHVAAQLVRDGNDRT